LIKATLEFNYLSKKMVFIDYFMIYWSNFNDLFFILKRILS